MIRRISSKLHCAEHAQVVHNVMRQTHCAKKKTLCNMNNKIKVELMHI